MKRQPAPTLFSLLVLLLFPASTAFANLDSTRVAVHADPVLGGGICPGVVGSRDPNTMGIPCSGYTTESSAFATVVYLVVVTQDDTDGVLYLSCGIDYGSNLYATWIRCSDGLEFPGDGGNGNWPAPAGGNRITWTTCQTTTVGSDGVHAVAGAFYVYAYGNDLFQVTPNNTLMTGPELIVQNCVPTQTDIMSNPRGSVGFGSVSGFNPCCTSSGVIHVPTDYTTIQDAIDASVCDGDTILVADGTYSGVLNRNLNFNGKNLHLVSEHGPALTVIDCGSSGAGLVFENGETNFSLVDGFTIRNAANSGVFCYYSSPTIQNCIFENCASPSSGGAMRILFSDHPIVAGCSFLGNNGVQNGGAISVNSGSLEIRDCSIQGNSTPNLGGGIYATGSASVDLLRCLIAGNRAGSLGGGIYTNGAALTLTACTVTANDGSLAGGGIRLLNPASTAILTRTILTDNCADTGEDMALSVSAYAAFLCSVVDGARIDAEVGTTVDFDVDTFLTDPLFCAPEPCASAPTIAGDYTLHEESLCLADVSPCNQLIGARDQGCEYAVTDIADVGNDQGRQVRIRWNRSGQDRADAVVPVTFYGIWRRVEAGLSPGVNPLAGKTPYESQAFPPGDWEFIQSVPASVEPVYIAIAPTLCDSTSAGMCLSTFVIRAQTNQPALYYDTAPDSGYSVDNLAPAAPLNLLLAAGNLSWDEAPEADFNYFTVYGSDAALLDPSATLIDYTVAPDLDVSSHPYAYYHVTATDFSGNEGSAATASNPVSAPAPGLPAVYALRPCSPNPYRASTRIAFDLPRAGIVRLQVFDVTGRRVRTLIDAPMDGGTYTVPWLGRDDAGRRVPPGIYFYRLESGPFRRTLKAVRIG